MGSSPSTTGRAAAGHDGQEPPDPKGPQTTLPDPIEGLLFVAVSPSSTPAGLWSAVASPGDVQDAHISRANEHQRWRGPPATLPPLVLLFRKVGGPQATRWGRSCQDYQWWGDLTSSLTHDLRHDAGACGAGRFDVDPV